MYKDYRVFLLHAIIELQARSKKLFTGGFNSFIIIIQHKFVEVSKNLTSLHIASLHHLLWSIARPTIQLLNCINQSDLFFHTLRGHIPALVNQCKRHNNPDQPLTLSVRETKVQMPTNQHLTICIRYTQDDRSALGTHCIKNTRTQTKTCHSG